MKVGKGRKRRRQIIRKRSRRTRRRKIRKIRRIAIKTHEK